MQSKNGVITTNLAATNHMIEGDRVQISNVLTNIIDNGVKYSDKPPHIDISTHDDPHGIVIRISDNGIGISNTDISHIFEKFYRVHTGDKHDVKGYGIAEDKTEAIKWFRKAADQGNGLAKDALKKLE